MRLVTSPGDGEGPEAGRLRALRQAPSGVHGLRIVLGEEVPGTPEVQRDARAHRRRQGRLLDVVTLGGRRLEPEDLLQRGRVVLHERGRVERGLADDEVEVRVLVDAELDLAALD